MKSYDDYGPKSTVADYDLSSMAGIEADIAAMEDFAAKLQADLQDNYAPHANAVAEAMFTKVPTNKEFYELDLFLYTHQQVQDLTQKNVDLYYEGTHQLAVAAQNVSAKYRDSDAFSRATVADVEAEFKKSGAVAPPPGGTSAPAADPYTPSGEA
ncbi:hypothetical protein [Actinoplanes utahensis]|uniref:hypothetical protein n=1 Tax=Actinoplanes utahensis TaxID=1869 RepID=UPI00068EC165|nr:hypothetical protein [Actinoplanes utahensis]GIF29145.1 hypothetical protein Aut01nite_21310 [Actinoplanes utahensis]